MSTQAATNLVIRKATWEMSARELAITFADVQGFTGRKGGWIYSPDGRPVAQGWNAFAHLLLVRNVIVPGKGINWSRAHRAL